MQRCLEGQVATVTRPIHAPYLQKAHTHCANPSIPDSLLEALLVAKGIKQVVVTGAMSHMCVEAATRAAADLGFDVTVLHDACATLDVEFGTVVVPAEHVHAVSMSALAFAYAKVVTTQEWINTGAK